MTKAMYFIAIKVPEAIDKEVLQWKHLMRDRFGCIVALKSPAHITLISPFWMQVDLQSALETAMTEFSTTQKSFPVTLRNFDCFRPRVIFVHVETSEFLDALKGGLEDHILKNGFAVKRETRVFHPHITIANRDLHKRDFATAWEHFTKKRFTASFIADGITLLKHNGTRWESVHTASFRST